MLHGDRLPGPPVPPWIAPLACAAWLAGAAALGDTFPFARVDVTQAATRERVAVLEVRARGVPVDVERFVAFEGLDPDALVVPGAPASGLAASRRVQAWIAAHPAGGRDPAAAVPIEVGYRWLTVDPSTPRPPGPPPGARPQAPDDRGARVEPPPPDLLPGGVDPAGESFELRLPPEAIDQPAPGSGEGPAGEGPAGEGTAGVRAGAGGAAATPPPVLPVGADGWTRLTFGVGWEGP